MPDLFADLDKAVGGKNTDKIILDLCGGTGAWSRPYQEANYDVRIITAPEYDVCKYEPPNNVYGILAAPPCTMFSIARTTAKIKRSFETGMKCVKACLRIIWQCRYQNKLKFWALENPVGYLRQFLGKPPLTFNPCDYGDPWTKRTDIWGYFNMPKQKPVDPESPTLIITKNLNTKLLSPLILKTGFHCPNRDPDYCREIFATTPSGFANAFFKENK